MEKIQDTTPPLIQDLIDIIDKSFWEENGYYLSTSNPTEFAKIVAIEFAKLHCTQALKQASEQVTTKLKEDVRELSMNDEWTEIDKDSILNSYPLSLIK